jgi:hypothetical protein
MKQLDVQNFEANIKKFYLDHDELEITPLLEGYLQLQYPLGLRQPMDQKTFNDYAELVFSHVDPKEVQRSISIASNLLVNTVLPHCKNLGK